MEKCPNCGQNIEKWKYSDFLARGSGPIGGILRLRRTCPHCSSGWSRKFVSRRGLGITIAALALSIAPGLLLGQFILESAGALGITTVDDTIKIAIMAGFTIGFLSLTACLIAGLRIFTRWQLTDPTRLCNLCRAPIIVTDARFCPQCGKDQTASTESIKASELPSPRGMKDERITFLRDEPPMRCTVCKMAIGHSDEVIWCPHCGGTAHRDEFLEWLHVKGRCPACRQHVDERELQMVSVSTVYWNGQRDRRKAMPAGKATPGRAEAAVHPNSRDLIGG